MRPPHPFTLRQLQYVVAVAEQRSFRGAAEACHVAQPSLSAQIAQIEEALGVLLFERDKRHVALTSAGEALLARIRPLLLGADELVASALTLSDPLAGSLKLGVIPTLGPYLLPDVAPLLRAEFPRLAFVWVEEKTSTLVERLGAGELDGAVVALEAEIGDLPHVLLGEDPFLFAAPKTHPLASGKRPLQPTELDGERVLLLDDGHCFREQALSFCARVGAEEADYRATSLATLVQMVAGGAGVTLLPRLAIAVENRTGALSLRTFAGKPPSRTLALVYRRGAAREATLKQVGQAMSRAYGLTNSGA
jgi:LysR family hydrogen peroxide-inducible transcriptional activator